MGEYTPGKEREAVAMEWAGRVVAEVARADQALRKATADVFAGLHNASTYAHRRDPKGCEEAWDLREEIEQIMERVSALYAHATRQYRIAADNAA